MALFPWFRSLADSYIWKFNGRVDCGGREKGGRSMFQFGELCENSSFSGALKPLLSPSVELEKYLMVAFSTKVSEG